MHHARPRSQRLRRQPRRSPGVREALRPEPFGAELPAGHAAGRVGRRFVTVTPRRLGHAHRTISPGSRDQLLPQLDAGLSGLFNALAAKGLLDSTTVFVTGEFGRTPKINTREPKAAATTIRGAMFCSWRGGGIRAAR